MDQSDDDDIKNEKVDRSEDDLHRDASSRSSKYSDYEDDSMFEPDLDYEPEETDSNEEDDAREEHKEVKKTISDDSIEKLVHERSKRPLLSSDDDDIEVIDVINKEESTPKESRPIEERKEHSKGRNFSGPVVKEEVKENKDAESRSRSRSLKRRSRSRSPRRSARSKSVSRDRLRPSSRSYKKRSPSRDSRRFERGGRDTDHEPREQTYSREDLEKVKAFFAANQNKRKDAEQNRESAKKLKGNDGKEFKQEKDDWIKQKLEREGKVFIRNYIPFPSSQKSNFKSDIKTAFKDELNDEILMTLTPTYCGLCFKDFDDDVVAWKHYTGANHKGTIKRFNRGTYMGHPPFWRMVHERLCQKDPAALTDKEVFEEVCENYNVGDNKEKLMYLVKKNISCLMKYDLIGLRNDAYFVKNKNVQDVRKIFENYYFDKKRHEESDQRRFGRHAERVEPDRRYEGRSSSSSHRRSSQSHSRYPEDRSSGSATASHSRHSSSSGYPARQPNLPIPGNQMLVVDPSKLRMLPNGQIMIKPDDVKSMRPGEVV